jgi:hypothetical protein
MRHERYKSDGYIRIPGMPLAVTERPDLLHPDRRLAQCVLRDSSSRSVKHFSNLRDSPRQRPSFPLRRIASQENCQLVPHRGDYNDVDSVRRGLQGAITHGGCELVTF